MRFSFSYNDFISVVLEKKVGTSHLSNNLRKFIQYRTLLSINAKFVLVDLITGEVLSFAFDISNELYVHFRVRNNVPRRQTKYDSTTT